MIHPIFVTALRRPELLVRHFSNYVALLRSEVNDIFKGVAGQAVAGILALVFVLLALGLTGVAAILAGIDRFHWVLVMVPGISWLCAIAATFVAMRSRLRKDINDVREEVEIDMTILRLIKETKDE